MYISVQLPFTRKVLVNDFLAAGTGSKMEPSSSHHIRTVKIKINVFYLNVSHPDVYMDL